MAINLKDIVQIIRGKKTDIAARIGANGELNWADDTYELYIHDGKTRGGHLIGKASGTAGVVGGAGIAVSTSDGISTVSIKRDPSNVLYATTDGAGVRIGTSGALQITAQNALDLRVAEGGGIIVDSNGVKIDSAVLSSVFRYAGQVNSVDDLPSDAQPGDVYDVKDSGANYVWSGTSWDNLGGIMSVDTAPTQGSTNPVASGGVYDAIQDTKLNGDGTTVTVASNTITAKDIAIGGDTGDLASASGLLGTCKYIPGSSTTFNIDTDVFDEVLVSSTLDNSHGTFPYTGWWIVRQFNYLRTPDSRLQVAFIWGGSVRERIYTRYWWNTSGAWSSWVEFVTSSTIGDGITVNNGIISVPEYEGATADTAATSGLVPPAEAGQQSALLGGDGEWHATDGVTIAQNSSGQLMAQDIAINGNARDLASARGLFNFIIVEDAAPDLNTFTKQGVYFFYAANASAGVNFPDTLGGTLVVYASRNQYLRQIYYSVTSSPRVFVRSGSATWWSEWSELLMSSRVGDGITVNGGIISVPEYEGATASAPATSGLVPPATAGQEGYVLGGDGEWHPADSTPVGTIVWSAATTAPNGYLLCNGATVGRETYSALFAAIGTTYGAGDGSTTFALPNLIGRVMWGGTSPGSYLEAGLPGFGGSFQAFASAAATGSGDFSQAIPGTGAQKYNITTLASSFGGEGFTDVSINPDSIYGNSNTVQPPALTLVPYIKAFSAATNQGMINLTSLANDIAALDAERLKQIGQIQTFVSTNLPEGWMICDGSSVLFADWPEFQQVYNEGRFTGMTLSAADPTQKGKFVLNGSSGVYLPDLEGLFVQTSVKYVRAMYLGKPSAA